MCLSTVYKQAPENNIFMFKNIAKVQVNEDELIFTDLFGVRSEIKGSIIDIDLMENIILVKEA